MTPSKVPVWMSYAMDPNVRRRGLKVALLVGSILNIINQGDSLFKGIGIDWFKIALTYLVPYCVATYGAVSFRLDQEKKLKSGS